MRKFDLEFDHEYGTLDVMNGVNRVLYEQGFGIQFECDDRIQDELVRYNLVRSTELIQE
jgi:hypothetical protein